MRAQAFIAFITFSEIASRLAVSRMTVYRRVRDGGIPGGFIRRSYYPTGPEGRPREVWAVRREVFEKWLLSQENRASR